MELHTFKKGTYICREFEPIYYLYFLVEGKAKVYKTMKNGNVTLVHFCKSIQTIGELEMLKAQNTTQAVKTIFDSICIGLPLNKCREQILNDAFFLRNLCTMLSEKVVKNTINFTTKESFPLENRLADYILITEENSVFKENLTEASEYLGSSYRHLLRTLANLCSKKILKKEHHGYIILNYSYLKEMSCDAED